MVDTTAWANVRLPSTRHEGTESLAKMALYGQTLAEGKRKAEMESNVNAASQRVLDSWKGQDRKGMMYALSEVARYDPDRARKLKDRFQDLDRTNAFQAAMLMYTAAASDTEEAQNTALDQALQALQVGPTNPFFQELLEIKGMPFGPGKDNALIEGVKAGQDVLGLFPSKEEMYGTAAAGAGATNLAAERLAFEKVKAKYEILNKMEDNARLERELNQQIKEFGENSRRLNPTQMELLESYNKTALEGMTSRDEYMALADEFEKPENQKRFGGLIGQAETKIRQILGKDYDKFQIAKTNYNKLRNAAVRASIQESRPTDFDVQYMESGFPGKDAEPRRVAQWLRGIAKAQGILSAQANAQSDWMNYKIDQGKTHQGFKSFWRDYGDWYIEQINGPPVDENGSPVRTTPPEPPPNEITGNVTEQGRVLSVPEPEKPIGMEMPGQNRVPLRSRPSADQMARKGRGKLEQLKAEEQNREIDLTNFLDMKEQADVMKRYKIARKKVIDMGLATEENVGSVLVLSPDTLQWGIEKNGVFESIEE